MLNFLESLGHRGTRNRGHENVIQPKRTGDSLLHRRKRHHHKIILVLTVSGKSLGFKYADYLAGQAFDTNYLVNGIVRREQVIYDGLSQYAHQRIVLNVTFRKEIAESNVPPSNLKELRRNATISG